MANAGSVEVDLKLTGSQVRLRALSMAIDTLNHRIEYAPPATKEEILERAAAFEQYISGKSA